MKIWNSSPEKKIKINIGACIFVFMVFISHFLLPYFNQGKDFFVLTTWQLFYLLEEDRTWDIYCLNDDTPFYLFQEKIIEAHKMGLRHFSFLKKLRQNNSSKEMNKREIRIALYLCESKFFELHEFKISTYDHLFARKRANPIVLSELEEP